MILNFPKDNIVEILYIQMILSVILYILIIFKIFKIGIRI